MSRRPWASAMVTGVAAGAVTLGVAELAALALARTAGSEGTPSPLLAVGGAFVDRTPPALKDFAIATFGTNDKIALFVGMALTLTLVCAAIGLLGTPRADGRDGLRLLGLVLFALVGVVGVTAVLSRPGAAPLDTAPTVLGVIIGLGVLNWLWGRLRGASREGAAAPSRRAVLAWGGGLTVLGAIGMVAGRMLNQAGEVVQAARQGLQVPKAPEPVTVPDGADLDIQGLDPYISPNDDFYRIDTALSVPQVDPGTWRLRVTGMVDQEVEIDFAELLEQDMIETLVTLTCVSNTVGGNLVDNALWTGWPIRELLDRAGVSPDADMILSTSVDGWTAGTPIEALTDERNAILAVAMNGEPLPPQHGFPVRMVVPGLYGYVSATKWVTELKVTTFAADEGYWTPRGWAERGPIKTQSRIDVPSRDGQVEAGEVVVAGVAWAQTRGISMVEVQVDEGDWQEATLAEQPSIDSWVQWSLPWQAEEGEHTIAVRATDGDGQTQTEELAQPVPDGASGWHTIDVRVAVAG
ncbi:MAG: molybdopterin-dependent oxidoreductase [Actinomycetota bacterium]|nr:molybdopterin-dependent oxidoreductase [Actinomycetota bacterium]